MRNKGFFWFISITLIAVCLYQLSFTWVASNVEGAAEIKANQKVKALRLEADKNNGIAFLNNDTINFNDSDGAELAKATYLNEILREKGEKEVYPVFGSTFSQVKRRSLAFGLDLVGGMSVTLEISLPDLIKNYAKNPRDLKFRKPFEAAIKENDKDFLDAFIANYKKMNKGLPLHYVFRGEGIGIRSTDAQVEEYFRKLIASSMDGVEQIMSRRINQFGVAQPNIQKDGANNRLYIELPGVLDENTVAQKLQSTANLEFFETYSPSQLKSEIDKANSISLKTEVEASVDSTATDSLTFESITSDKSISGKGLVDLITPVGDYAIGAVSFNDKAAVEAILRRNDVMEAFPPTLKFMWGC